MASAMFTTRRVSLPSLNDCIISGRAAWSASHMCSSASSICFIHVAIGIVRSSRVLVTLNLIAFQRNIPRRKPATALPCAGNYPGAGNASRSRRIWGDTKVFNRSDTCGTRKRLCSHPRVRVVPAIIVKYEFGFASQSIPRPSSFAARLLVRRCRRAFRVRSLVETR